MGLISKCLFAHKIADMIRLQLFELMRSNTLSRSNNQRSQLQDGMNCGLTKSCHIAYRFYIHNCRPNGNTSTWPKPKQAY